MIGGCVVHHDTGTGLDEVTVAPGETLTKAEFWARYPRGLLIERTVYGPRSGPVRAGDGRYR